MSKSRRELFLASMICAGVGLGYAFDSDPFKAGVLWACAAIGLAFRWWLSEPPTLLPFVPRLHDEAIGEGVADTAPSVIAMYPRVGRPPRIVRVDEPHSHPRPTCRMCGRTDCPHPTLTIEGE